MKDSTRIDWSDLAEQLSQDVILGRRHPRERLIEDEIIGATGATRHAVRRAFDELERLGLVERQVNRGVRVRHYSREEVEELYEIRDALERRAALRFDCRGDPILIADLRQIADQHEAACNTGDMVALFKLNNRFHARLYGAAGNAHLAEAIQHYTVATHPIRTRAFPDAPRRREAAREHRAMIDLIEKGQAAALADAVSDHIRKPKELYLAHLDAIG